MNTRVISPAFGHVLTHHEVAIYHTHKNDDPDQYPRPLTFWFSLDACAQGEPFDVRELPGAGEEPEGLSEQEQWIEATLLAAIECQQIPGQATAARLSGELARARAEARARASGQVWVSYRCRAGEMQAELLSAGAVRRALLAVGTKGGFSYHTASGNLRLHWKSGLNLLRQLRA